MEANFSIVHYFSEQEKHKCGYCKKLDTNASKGMWAQCLTVQDYQDLIDRGWRRSGKYCYKPIMDLTCCPMYTIRCEALDLKLSKSQKKILRRVKNFLETGTKEKGLNPDSKSLDKNEQHAPMDASTTSHEHLEIDATKIQSTNIETLKHKDPISTENKTESISTTATIISNTDNEISSNSMSKANLNVDMEESEKNSFLLNDYSESLVKPVTYYITTNPFYIWIGNYFISSISETFYIWFESFSVTDIFRVFWEGIDPTKPPCKKAKLMRVERKKQKLAAAGLLDNLDTSIISNKKMPQEGKTLEQFINSASTDKCEHKLRISLVRTKPQSEEWLRTAEKEYAIYVKYQMSVHKDPLEKCTEHQFNRFLVESPIQVYWRLGKIFFTRQKQRNTQLKLVRMTTDHETFHTSAKLFAKYQMVVHNEPPPKCDTKCYLEFLVETPLQPFHSKNGPPLGYGSFHQQYWLDDNLIAVGVIDVLPKCVSSVYFFYDPDYSHLSLGTYGSLRELEFTRELHTRTPEIEYYYMGFYIHTCPKMRYKANLSPSYLLCPETYCWFPIEPCIAKLNIDSYARFNDDLNALDANRCERSEIRNVLVLNKLRVMKYYQFRTENDYDDNDIYEYANLVGRKAAFHMFLVID